MAVLVLKLSGPFQSWGTVPKLRDHGTDPVPSKSGVIGMIAAAFGRRRDEDISDLRVLRFGVRTDAPGIILPDYHTARHVKGRGKEDTYVSNRSYIEDACFTVGLEGDREFLEMCRDALLHPVFPPYLGRRCCPPDPGLVVGIYDRILENVLKSVPAQREGRDVSMMKISVETNGKGERMRRDSPVSYDYHKRQYTYRSEKDL